MEPESTWAFLKGRFQTVGAGKGERGGGGGWGGVVQRCNGNIPMVSRAGPPASPASVLKRWKFISQFCRKGWLGYFCLKLYKSTDMYCLVVEYWNSNILSWSLYSGHIVKISTKALWDNFCDILRRYVLGCTYFEFLKHPKQCAVVTWKAWNSVLSLDLQGI